MVVSGINDGANLGDDVLYSGTVAAAVEGRFLGLPTHRDLAVHRAGGGGAFRRPPRRSRGSSWRSCVQSPLEPSLILNVNVPDLPLRGAARVFAARVSDTATAPSPSCPRTTRADDRCTGSDRPAAAGRRARHRLRAVAQGYVSVTPLQIDLTRHAALPALQTLAERHPWLTCGFPASA